MLKASEPVAGSPTSIVLAFDYEIVCARAAGDDEIQLAIQNSLSRLIDYAPEIVCITRESWPNLRKTFIQQNKDDQPESAVESSGFEGAVEGLPEEDGAEAEASNGQEIVNEAVSMFGTDIVEIVND